MKRERESMKRERVWREREYEERESMMSVYVRKSEYDVCV